MTNSIVRLPLGYSPDPAKGRPLFDASIYIGEPDTDPRIGANQKTVTGRQEDGTELPLSQPIKTSAGGVPVDSSGNYVTLLVDGAYSMAVDDKKNIQVYYFADVLDGAPLTIEDMPDVFKEFSPDYSFIPFDTVADAKAGLLKNGETIDLAIGDYVRTGGYNSVNDGGGASYVVVGPSTGIDDGGSYHDMVNGNQLKLEVKNGKVDSKVFGAVNDSTNGLDGTDSSLAFNNLSAFCLSNGYKALITESPGEALERNYRIDSTVDFRKVEVLSEARIWVNTTDIGVILGGNSLRGTNPDQDINTVQRTGGLSNANPTIRVAGAKGQRVWVKYTDYLQFWGDSDDAETGSIGYCSFYINWAAKLGLEANQVNGGWVNENYFFLNRCQDLVIAGSSAFRMNHNHFYGGTFENTCSLTFEDAADNKFYGMRFENGPTTITFNNNTERNVIINTWAGSEFGGWPDNPLASGTITDNGGPGNIVIDESRVYRTGIVVVEASASDWVWNNITVSGSDGFSLQRERNLQRVLSGAPSLDICISDYLPIYDTGEDHYFFRWEDNDIGDDPRYVAVFSFYDEQKKPATGVTTDWVKSSNINVASGNEVRSSLSGLISGAFGRVTKTAAQNAKYMRVHIRPASDLSRATSRRVSAVAWSYNRSDQVTPSRRSRELIRPNVVAARPTQSYVPLGFQAVNGNFTERYHCTSVTDTTLSAAALSGETVLSVTDVTGFAVGDILGINTDDRNTSWGAITTLEPLTIDTPLSGNAASGNRVVRNRWRTESFSVA